MAEKTYEQQDVDGIDQALQCLSDATAALKKVRQQEDKEDTEEAGEGETPLDEQPKDLKTAAAATRREFTRRRKSATK